jgi:3-hydroxyisobutyrate dehydrogenase
MSASTPSPVVAVLGTGALGQAMAVRLVDEGFTVRVWNRTARRTEAVLAERPAITAHASVADAVAGASAVLTVVRDEPALQDVADKLLPTFPAGAVEPETGASR